MPFVGFQTLGIALAGHYPALPDVAGFAERYQRTFDLDVFAHDPQAAPAYGEYDPGLDSVTDSLVLQGVWEAQESTAAVDILARTEGIVLDFGAHVGWYSVLAGLAGHQVVAIDSDPLCLRAVRCNADRYSLDIETVLRDVDDDSPVLAVDTPVALWKCDIEGQECNAVRMSDHLFRSRSVAFALIEVSPIFTGDGRSTCDYVDLLGRMMAYGYDCYRVPPKGWEHNDAYREDPLDTLVTYCRLPDDGWQGIVAGCRQDNFVLRCR